MQNIKAIVDGNGNLMVEYDYSSYGELHIVNDISGFALLFGCDFYIRIKFV